MPIELGDLEYSPEDFVLYKNAAEVDPHGIADLANCLLRERLTKTVEMFARQTKWSDGSHFLWAEDECPYFARATHRGRLVALETIKK